jgi:molybdopterin synthase catalytic subunit
VARRSGEELDLNSIKLPKIRRNSVTIAFHDSAIPPITSNTDRDADSSIVGFAPLSVDRAYNLADDSRNGAIVVMSGMVRDNTDGRSVEYLEYQAYEPMVERVFTDISRSIRETWPEVTKIVIHHRTGKLKIGEISVLVAIGCPHRGEAFAAAQYAIDTLKHTAPIWKKEYWVDGESSWVNIGDCERNDPIGTISRGLRSVRSG